MPVRLRMLPIVGRGPNAQSGPTEERAIDFGDDAHEIRIGRRPDVELPLPFRTLSGVHAQLSRSSDGWRIEDLGSTNGTRLDGKPIDPGQPHPLGPGTQIALGDVTLVFDGPVSSGLGAEGTATIARRLVSDLLAASPGLAAPILTVVAGASERTLVLEALDHRYVVGRAETCDLRLPSEEVSREHAAFSRRWDGAVVIDLGSKNGVRVNDQPILDERRLRDGDLVDLGPITLRVSDPADRYLRDFEAREPPRDHDGAPDPAPIAATAPLEEARATEAAPAPAPVEGAPARANLAAAESPAPVAGRSRTAMAVAAVALLVVGAAVLLLILGT